MKMAAQSSSKLVQLFKKGWIEIPEIMAGCTVGLFAIGIGIYGVNRNSKKLVERPFKTNYIVLRDDDQRAEPYKLFHEKPVY